METKSFYSLISEHVIEVPIIQREYAQGRTSERVTTIRKRFVNDLIKYINNNEVMHLGFIYGKIEGRDKQRRKQINRDAVNSILQAVKAYATTLELQIDTNIKETISASNQYTQLKFIPLDGQQRLTTLYLLHWYLYLKGAQTSQSFWIHNFNYTNRKSTMDFLKVINEEVNFRVIQERIGNGINIKSVIVNASFYLQKWNKDKTVVGLLEMLQSIENELKQDKDFSYSSLNLDTLKFQFDFMDLDTLNQTNELYVKMNSRGKQLTNYEHFKSWLQNQYSNEVDQDWLNEFWRNLDNKWLNFFWRRLDADFNKLDDFYFNFLKNMALMKAIASNPQIPLKSFKDLIELVRNDKTYNQNKVSYISFDKFYVKWIEKKEVDGIVNEESKVLFIFNKEILRFIEKSFNTLIKIDLDSENISFLDNVICKPFFDKPIDSLFFADTEFTPSQPDTIFYYAIISLFNKHGDTSDEDLKTWLRIIRNLIFNTYIQGYEDFYKALHQISYLLDRFEGFNHKLIDYSIDNSFFDSSQFKEEVLKAKLIAENKSWFDLIVKCENHNYFQGQIKFLIDFSRRDGEYDIEAFEKYSSSASILFSDNIRLSDEQLLQRILLSQGDYLPSYKSNNLFCIGNAGGLRTRNENWRLFFKSEKSTILKNLIDDLDGELITENYLSNYIEQNLKSLNYNQWNWRFLFLKYPKAIAYCNQGFIKKYSDNDIRLLPKTNVGGIHAELRSYCFYLENIKAKKQINEDFYPFDKINYYYQQNSDAHPACYLSGLILDDKSYHLDIRHSKTREKFELNFLHQAGEIEDRDVDEKISQILRNRQFSFDKKYRHFFKNVNYIDIYEEIKGLCVDLKGKYEN